MDVQREQEPTEPRRGSISESFHPSSSWFLLQKYNLYRTFKPFSRKHIFILYLSVFHINLPMKIYALKHVFYLVYHSECRKTSKKDVFYSNIYKKMIQEHVF
jgi:hypothetical protein